MALGLLTNPLGAFHVSRVMCGPRRSVLGAVASRASDDVMVLVVTSPAPSHPSTALIWTVIDSLSSTPWPSLPHPAKTLIICDGYKEKERQKENDFKSSKRGIVGPGAALAFMDFKATLRQEAISRGAASGGRTMEVRELDGHEGFAMCVRRGLEQALEEGFRFALVLQHDRAFLPISNPRREPEQQQQEEEGEGGSCMDDLLALFDKDRTIRYMGFPTTTSRAHATVLAQVYIQVISLIIHDMTFFFSSRNITFTHYWRQGPGLCPPTRA